MAIRFGIARDDYAHAVQVDLIPRCKLTLASLGQTLSVHDRATLGTWARSLYCSMTP